MQGRIHDSFLDISLVGFGVFLGNGVAWYLGPHQIILRRRRQRITPITEQASQVMEIAKMAPAE